ncbi:unnamed protein product [Rhizophagus irregularis]|nr:unnamed protein product [Rhizophagus irregularis]
MFGKIVDVQQKRKLKRIGNTIYQHLAKLWMEFNLSLLNQTNYVIGVNALCHQKRRQIFQNMLNMKFDDDKDNGEVLEDQASLEDNDDNVVVFA